MIAAIQHTFGQSPQTENRLKKLIRIWRALHEYVNFVHDPEKQYRSLSEWSATGVNNGADAVGGRQTGGADHATA